MKIKKFNENKDFEPIEDWEEEDENRPSDKTKKLFIKALRTLFWSWGGDTPPEATWTANELLNYYESAHNIKLNIRFQDEEATDYNNVIIAIHNS